MIPFLVVKIAIIAFLVVTKNDVLLVVNLKHLHLVVTSGKHALLVAIGPILSKVARFWWRFSHFWWCHACVSLILVELNSLSSVSFPFRFRLLFLGPVRARSWSASCSGAHLVRGKATGGRRLSSSSRSHFFWWRI